MKNKLPENNSIRLASLDILRGFDLFLLVFFQPVFVALARQMNMPFLDSILYQFDHEVWEGFRFWDLVMPLFLFMTGASMPFSLSKYIGTTGSYWPVYRTSFQKTPSRNRPKTHLSTCSAKFPAGVKSPKNVIGTQ